MINKPPIGLIPKRIWLTIIYEKRFIEIASAINRYVEAGMEIPIEWLNEYYETLLYLISEAK